MLGGTARGATGQRVPYVSRLEGEMMSNSYRVLVWHEMCVIPAKQVIRAEEGWVYVLAFGAMKRCKQPRLLVCPGALPC